MSNNLLQSKINPLSDQGPYNPILKSARAARVGNLWFSLSLKLGRIVQLYSDLERDHWLLVEGNPEVVTYCEQPCYISAVIDGKLRKSIPDMWIRYRDGREEFIEVKYRKDLEIQSSRQALQLEIQSKWAQRENASWRIVTDMEIRGNAIKLNNIAKMIHAIKCTRGIVVQNAGIHECNLLNSMACHGGKLKIGTLQKELLLKGDACGLSTVYKGLLSGKLHADFDREPITLEMIVSLPVERNKR